MFTILRFNKNDGHSPSSDCSDITLRCGIELIMQRVCFVFLFAAVLCDPATGIACMADASETVSPPLNTESTAQIGGAILRQGELYQRAAIHLSEEITFGQDGKYALTPGYYFRTGESDGGETYSPADGPDAGSVRTAPDAITLQGSFHYSNDGKFIGVITNFYQAVNAKAKGITRTTRPSWSESSIQRSLVYGGMKKTKIKLGYREIWKNITRPSHIVFVEYDLADSKIVEAAGARIEVLEATCTSIRYRVTQAFKTTEK